MNKVYIYGLVDNFDNELRYIGKSINPKSRLRKHIQDSKTKKTYRDKWIFSLIEKNEKPELLIIDEVNNHNWEFWEKHYISYYKSLGARLTNLTEGGENPPNNIGKKKSKEEVERTRKANLGKKRSDEFRKKMSFLKKGKPIPWLNNGNIRSIEHRNNLSKSCKGRKSPNLGKKFDEKLKQKLSDSSTSKKSVLQFSKMGEFIKKWNSISEAQKALHIRHISEVCRNKSNHKTSGGFIWRYE
jgi:group I intron endonuclease